jgi:two-component system chemotaxis sensor kinase CheA
MDDQEIINEFLRESAENLARLDKDMVQLERQPDDRDLLASVFRTIHTIKGTCGFFGFSRLEALTHLTEDLLAQMRDGRRSLDADLTTLILKSVDATRQILNAIETGGGEGPIFELELVSELKLARDQQKPQLEDAAATCTPQEEPAAARPDILTNPASIGAAGSGPQRHSAAADSTLRVDIGLLDRLMNLVGELVLTRNQLVQHNARREDPALNAVSQRLNLITSELQEGVMKTRMQPIGVVWNKLPRVVRDLATALEKQIGLEMEGADTELDRTIIEAIKDPLMHIVRNSCDHGIEAPAVRISKGKAPQGRLSLRAWHEGGQVNIEIADDGAGIDLERVKAKALERRLITEEQAARMSAREAVNLVFLPGFSTAVAVTSISGRGVGMDVVRTHIERIGGAVDLNSRSGEGTTVRVRIPLTLAIIPGLVVTAGGERFVIPQVNLHELIQTGEGGANIEYAHSAPILRRRNALLPLVDLCAVLGIEPQRRAGEASIVVLQSDQHRFGLIVDSIWDSEEIVVKPLGHQLKPLACYAGATIMGDGRIALILDIGGLAQRSGMKEPSSPAAGVAHAAAAEAIRSQRGLILLFRAGRHERLAVPLSSVARLERIGAAEIEHAAGTPVVQYRDRILPLVNLAGDQDDWAPGSSDVRNVVVFRRGGSELGLLVDEILDIVDESIVDPRGADHPGLLGSAIIGGLVTDIVDLDGLADSFRSVESVKRLADALIDAGMPAEVLQ